MDELCLLKNIDAAADAIRSACGATKIALIAGSGLGGFAKELTDVKTIKYEDIPYFPRSSVPGHAGTWVTGKIGGVCVSVMNGRVHGYEGHGHSALAFPVRVMARLGVKKLIVTNAAGGVNTSYNPGDFMLITDFINMSGMNPLRGANVDELGPRFPDMSQALDLEMIYTAKRAASGFTPREGVYAMMAGPSFESPAEIRMVRTLGADAVGMSTVPEIITARHAGIRVLGISCITNMAAGILPQPLNHREVLETGERVAERFKSWMACLIEMIDNEIA
ncbi:purine nucleoside phosphorylase [Clostridia bacterium]|nr:purine nucleoside phosphorylase [Clostridia bacterium]